MTMDNKLKELKEQLPAALEIWQQSDGEKLPGGWIRAANPEVISALITRQETRAASPRRLVEIGECMVDIDQIVAVEPHSHGYHDKKQGAKVTLQNGLVALETSSTLREVKAKLNAAIESRESDQ